MNSVENNGEARLNRIENIGNVLLERLTYLAKINEMPMTTQQAAYYLNCSVKTIYNYKRQGLLKEAVKGKLSGFLPSDLDKLRQL